MRLSSVGCGEVPIRLVRMRVVVGEIGIGRIGVGGVICHGLASWKCCSVRYHIIFKKMSIEIKWNQKKFLKIDQPASCIVKYIRPDYRI